MRAIIPRELDHITSTKAAGLYVKDAILVQVLLWFFAAAISLVIGSPADALEDYRSFQIVVVFLVPVFGTIFAAFRLLGGFLLLRKFPGIRNLLYTAILTTMASIVGLIVILRFVLQE